MFKLVLLSAILALPAGAALADGVEAALLGRDPGTGNAYACFARHYAAAHLAGHPHQNVREMLAFVASTYDKESATRESRMELGVGFRGLARNMEVSGDCSTDVDGQQLFRCGVDCDGGNFSVTTKGQSAVLISIPGYVRMWDPADTSDDPDPPLPKGAAFGSDDTAFQLDRVDVEQCRSLMTDEDKHALFGTPLPPDEPADGQ